MTDPPPDQAGPTPPAGEPHAKAGADCQLARAVAMCAADAGFLAGLEDILGQADRAATQRHFDCRQCGQCCRFEQFGHRLYVTAGELALMLHRTPDRSPAQAPAAGLCPHQDQARCLARAGRALGCRLFFCDPAAHDWFCDAYEHFHQRIKLLHAAHGLPYVYAELSAALAELAAVAG